MTPGAFLASMRAKGALFFVREGRLRWFAPSTPAPEDLARAQTLKAELLALIGDPELETRCAGADSEEAAYLREERAAILEHEAGLSPVEAELRAGLAYGDARSEAA